MQRTMSSEELTVYTSRLLNPSETFKKFLNDYVTGDTWTRSRESLGIAVWKNLSGEELEIAKQIILDELQIVIDPAYIQAVGIFRDERAIPILKSILNNYPDRFIAEKMQAAKILFDWLGYKEYIAMLEEVCKRRDEPTHSYFTQMIGHYIDSMEKSDRKRILKALKG